LYRTIGDLSLAKETLDQALTIRENLQGVDHLDTAHTLISIGEVYLSEGDKDAARKYFERAWKILEPKVAPTHYDLQRLLGAEV
jgi:predicted negative regulator of RcsB-dependent stress response